jgi:hypothetical protein
MTLRRYWFPATLGFGVGVTALSHDEAQRWALEALSFLPPGAAFTGEVVEDVDIRTLDQGHVIPNMLPPSNRGVWYPMGHRSAAL